MITNKDLDLIEERLEKTFVTKDYLEDKLQSLKSDLLSKLDSILKEILASREEETILAHRVSDHEERITKLETTSS